MEKVAWHKSSHVGCQAICISEVVLNSALGRHLQLRNSGRCELLGMGGSPKEMDDGHVPQDKQPSLCVFLKDLSEAWTESQ